MASSAHNVSQANTFSGFHVSTGGRIHNGDVYNQYSSPAAPPRPVPEIVVPFGPDPDYVERGNILEKLSSLCRTKSRRAALVGLGGTGKSQIAIEFAYRSRKDDDQLWVFWIHAASAVRFRDSLHQIANVLELPYDQEEKKTVPWLVKRWFERTDERWLLFIDNFDDKSVLFSPKNAGHADSRDSEVVDGLAQLYEYIPGRGNGAVVITSRVADTAKCLVDDDQILTVDAMDAATASALASVKLKRNYDAADVQALVRELDCIPLAIVQAVACINISNGRTTIQAYIADFRKKDKLTRMLKRGVFNPRRDARDESSSSIIQTWTVSFEQIRRDNRLAAELLSMMSMFDREGIPDRLLRRPWEHVIRESCESDDSIDYDLDDDIGLLRAYSLIHARDQGNDASHSSRLFSMHRLVQVATLDWLKAQDELSIWRLRYTKLLSRFFPESFERIPTSRGEMLLPHVMNLLDYSPEPSSDLTEMTARATVLSRAARFASETGRYAICVKIASEAYRVREELYGPHHQLSLSSLRQLATAHHFEGEQIAALAEIGQAKKGLIELLGVDHVDSLGCMHDEAFILCWSSHYVEAEDVAKDVFERRAVQIGENHLDTLLTLQLLSTIKRRRGQFKEALKLCELAYERSRNVYGTDHEFTLKCMHFLGIVLRKQSQLAKAEEFSRAALEGRLEHFSAEHPLVLHSQTELAVTLERRGKYDEALRLSEETLEIRERVLGPQHPSTLTSLSNLGALLRQRSEYDRAEDCAKRALDGRRMKIGTEHPDTLTSASSLALILQDRGKIEEAEKIQREILHVRQRKLGDEHNSTLTTLCNLAVILFEQRKFTEARFHLESCLAMREKTLVAEHVDTLTAATHLARVMVAQGEFDGGLKIHESVLEACESKFNETHPSTSRSAHYFAMGLEASGQLEKALAMYERAFKSREARFGLQHLATKESSDALEKLKLKILTQPDRSTPRSIKPLDLKIAYDYAAALTPLSPSIVPWSPRMSQDSHVTSCQSLAILIRTNEETMIEDGSQSTQDKVDK